MLLHLAFGIWLHAAPAGDTVLARREVDSLLASLRRSGCRFQRNGSWYDASAAADHLERKRKYMREHGGIASAETFIAKAGTESSWTGRPYSVQCPDRPAQPSSEWLLARLRALRGR